MDVPTRQSYVIAVVDPDERSAAAGVTGIARTTGAAISPSLSSRRSSRAPGYAAAAVLPRGRLQDPLRPADVPRVPQRSGRPRSGRSRDELGAVRRSGLGGGSDAAPAGPASRAATRRTATTASDDDDRDQQVERLEGVADVVPVRAEDRARVDEQHRPQERAGGREDDERPSGIRATPAGKLMNVRTIGSSRPKNTVAAPCLAKNRSASSISCGRMSRYLP